ncbi:MAG: HD domain-containing protein [Lachnospiraceae bacterium]|nr:HD domain-containing protein [Lachnospiraceae bacterium]
MKTFAAIDIGSYELEMKIYELSSKKGMKQIDDIRHRLDLGSDTYAKSMIPYEKVTELCNILNEFREIMKTYQVTAYKAYGTSAIRESKNTRILLDQIHQRTGIKIDVLSNSEQRFMDYKSVASKTEHFNRMMKEDTAILDIGGGSIQLSLFEKGILETTQNMKLGVLRLQERLNHLNASSAKIEQLIDEMITSQLAVFKKMYLKGKDIKHIIVIDDYLSVVMQKNLYENEPGYISKEGFFAYIDEMKHMTLSEIAEKYGIPGENALLLLISSILVRSLMSLTGAQLIWASGVSLCDGIAYEYAEQNKIFKVQHDFDADILSSAENISKRYMGSRKRSETLATIALTIFDSMKKVHGLTERERFLLQLATILHDCGKYISMVNLGECSYNIIMSTEIIGLSHREREIVANVVKYNHNAFEYYEALGMNSTLDAEAYLTIAKLTAILRVANALDRSHKQKFQNVKTTLKEGNLVIHVDTGDDITLEKGLFQSRADFFEEVFSVRPTIRQKKSL